MRVGIPEYRLPRNILADEIQIIREAGVDIRTNTRVESVDWLFEQGYGAVFLGIGAHQGTKMRVEGEDLPGVMDGASFLREVNLGKKVALGNNVAVIGGGNAAIDAARVALRVGARKVTIIYRRTRAEMPASPEEVEEALEEGIQIVFLVALVPSKITSKDGILQLECIRMKLGKPDATGRRQPEPVKGSEFTMEFDSVIAAIGQTPEIPPKFALKISRGNTLQVNAQTLQTSRKGVFAGGDAVTGPASVISAIAAGRQAASSIDKYLGGTGIIEEILAPTEELSGWLGKDEGFTDMARVATPCIPHKKRLEEFTELSLGLSPELAQKEAGRCFRCDLRLKISPVMLPPVKEKTLALA